MTDAVAILDAARLGYQMVYDTEGMVWHRKGTRMMGPFRNLDDAAYSALSDHEDEMILARIKETQVDQSS
jgi:hypothetical protein